jgi:hypothetical protein
MNRNQGVGLRWVSNLAGYLLRFFGETGCLLDGEPCVRLLKFCAYDLNRT